MRLRITVTDTDDEWTFDVPQELDSFNRVLGNCVATIDESRKGEFGYVGPAVEIRWVPDIILGEYEERSE